MRTTTGNAPKPKAADETALIGQMEKARPSQARLRKLAKMRRPPQSWYDETDCPFKPAKE